MYVNTTHDKIEEEWNMTNKGPLDRSYTFTIDSKWIKKDWSDEEKNLLRPIAETLAMLDGNAFFPHIFPDGREWYEQYLPEAATVFYENGGRTGGAGTASWILEQKHENDAVKDAYKNWKTLKILSKE
jgi:hypothetical protein